MQINELLPIGSVVRLKDAEKYLMIFGIKQSTSEQENEEVSDYICVPYPEGNLGLEYTFKIPLQISLDLRPRLMFGNNNVWTDGIFSFGIGVRYAF